MGYPGLLSKYATDEYMEITSNMTRSKEEYEQFRYESERKAEAAMRERDPHGKDANTPGAKNDADKNRLGLVLGDFANALVHVGHVGTFGANKYTDHGWLVVPDGVQRYTDALYRHLLAEAAGEVFDRDSDLLHAAHAAWNALAVLELKLRGR